MFTSEDIAKAPKDFTCGICSDDFSLFELEFLGSLKDFKEKYDVVQIDEDDNIIEECSPFMTMITMCKGCYINKVKDVDDGS